MDNKCKDCFGLKVNQVAINAAKEYKNMPGGVIRALHDIQNECGYISEDNQKYLSEKMNISLAKIYGIITFYNRFSLKPKGKHNIQVCTGTACYVKGANDILNEFKKILDVECRKSNKRWYVFN